MSTDTNCRHSYSGVTKWQHALSILLTINSVRLPYVGTLYDMTYKNSRPYSCQLPDILPASICESMNCRVRVVMVYHAACLGIPFPVRAMQVGRRGPLTAFRVTALTLDERSCLGDDTCGWYTVGRTATGPRPETRSPRMPAKTPTTQHNPTAAPYRIPCATCFPVRRDLCGFRRLHGERTDVYWSTWSSLANAALTVAPAPTFHSPLFIQPLPRHRYPGTPTAPHVTASQRIPPRSLPLS